MIYYYNNSVLIIIRHNSQSISKSICFIFYFFNSNSKNMYYFTDGISEGLITITLSTVKHKTLLQYCVNTEYFYLKKFNFNIGCFFF